MMAQESADVGSRTEASPTGAASATMPNVSDTHGTVDARGFSFWYGAKQALFDITLRIPPRTVTALIGPSGCGKSTFLRSINRMNDLILGTRHEGDIRLDSDELYARSIDTVQLRQRVGMVFQRSNPFPKSIYDNVAYGPRINGGLSRAQLDGLQLI